MADHISFDVTKEDAALLRQAAKRAHDMDTENNGPRAQDIMTWSMDLTACHANGCPLDLPKLLGFPNFDFPHDAFGIRRHIDRSTGKLQDCFLPRAAAKVYDPKEPGVLGRAIRETQAGKNRRS